MGITRRRLSVGSPTRMGDTDGTADILVTTIFHEIIHFPLRLIDVQRAVVVYKRYTSAVVAAILQSSKTFDQYRKSFLCAYITYYSAHILSVCVLFRLQNYTFSKKRASFYSVFYSHPAKKMRAPSKSTRICMSLK